MNNLDTPEHNTLEQDYTIIKHNIYLLNYMYRKNTLKLEYNNSEKEKIFSLITNSIFEDPYCFMRILLYYANTRKTTYQELFYKYLIHVTATVAPLYILSNLDLICELGRKEDCLYFLTNPNTRERTIKWIDHKAKLDKDFETLKSGNMIHTKSNIITRYKPKTGKNHKMSEFLEKVLADPNFNGIMAN